MNETHNLDHYAVVLNQIRDLMFERSNTTGWYSNVEPGEENPLRIATRLALIHSEVSEALEGYRKDMQDDHLPHRKAIEVELADAVIRIMDLAGECGLDIGGAIIEKSNYNLTRKDHKPEERKKTHGKKF